MIPASNDPSATPVEPAMKASLARSPSSGKGSYSRWTASIEAALTAALPAASGDDSDRVLEAARYSLLGGGKRVRPLLLILAGTLFGASRERLLPAAAALEMIHTYSLIHDDLPCMDDDQLRRGQPTCHVAFGEATALLAGDFLLNRAFERLLGMPMEHRGFRMAARTIAAAAGLSGMIGGQACDIAATGRHLEGDALRSLHERKTGALIRAALLAGGHIGCASEAALARLDRLGNAVGLAFQIQDDLLDVTATADQLGKTPLKDSRDGKATFVTLYGTASAAMRLDEERTAARRELDDLATTTGIDRIAWNDLDGYIRELLERTF